MTHLSDSQIETIRRELDERETTLRGEARAAVEAAAERPATFGPDVGDAVDAGAERLRTGMAHVDQQRDQEELMAIETARARIADGSYGECVGCGQSIPVERLKAQPTALRCVRCQSGHEKTHPAVPLLSV